MANHLKIDKKRIILKLLCEGCTVRGVERVVGTHRDTILRLLLAAGEHCESILENEVRGVYTSSLQLDELWAYVGVKERRRTPDHPSEFGDAYTYLALDRETKFVPAFEVGKRDDPTTDSFVHALSERVIGEVQIFTDGWAAYRTAIPRHFGPRANFAQVVKYFDGDTDENHRYSPPVVRSIEHVWIQGYPRAGLLSTSHVERHNWTVRTALRRFVRLGNGFSRKLANLRLLFIRADSENLDLAEGDDVEGVPDLSMADDGLAGQIDRGTRAFAKRHQGVGLEVLEQRHFVA